MKRLIVGGVAGGASAAGLLRGEGTGGCVTSVFH